MASQQHQAFNADPQVQPQRIAAYEYCTLIPSKPRQSMCLIGGGEIHLPQGGVIPVPPGDWITEMPDGSLASITKEEIADFWEFDDGSDEDRAAFKQTVESVKNARKAPGEIDNHAEPFAEGKGRGKLHPDGYEAAAKREADALTAPEPETPQEREGVLAAIQMQAQQAHDRLVALAGVGVERGLITKKQADGWIDSGVAPKGIHVTQDLATGSLQIERLPDDETREPDQPDSTEVLEDGATPRDYEDLDMHELWDLVHQKPVEPEGTGKDGAFRKQDLVKALREHDDQLEGAEGTPA